MQIIEMMGNLMALHFSHKTKILGSHITRNSNNHEFFNRCYMGRSKDRNGVMRLDVETTDEILKHEHIMCIINVENTHWFLFFVNLVDKCTIILDSCNYLNKHESLTRVSTIFVLLSEN